MKRIKIKELLNTTKGEKNVLVKGWVRTRRNSKGGFSFLEINDGSCQANIQVIVEHSLKHFSELDKKITTGSCVVVSGQLVGSEGKGQKMEIQVAEIEVYGSADAETYPLQKKRHSFEFLREIAHLRPRTNTFGAISRIRNAASAAVHDFFQQRDFLYIQTPVITTSDCEGAGQLFTVTTLNLERIARIQTEIDYAQDFFGKHASLTVSGQLEAEIFATSLGDCYTFGPTFRAENSNTTRHLSEFWMIEPEMPFYDLTDNMALAEEFIRHVIRTVLERCPEDMDFFNLRIDKTVLETLHNITENEFIRLPYTEAIDILLASDHDFEYPVEWGTDLQSEHERFLTEQHFGQPVILYDYPRSIKPFYMRCNDDGKTVRAMDVLVPRVGEIIGGSQREERLDVLEGRMRECNLEPEDYWWYVDLRRYGTVPHSGFGLGFERLIQLITGMQNIRDCIPFPRVPNSAEF